MNIIIYNNIIKIKKLRRRLNFRLKNLIIVVKNLNNYRQYVNKIINIVNNIVNRDYEKKY